MQIGFFNQSHRELHVEIYVLLEYHWVQHIHERHKQFINLIKTPVQLQNLITIYPTFCHTINWCVTEMTIYSFFLTAGSLINII